MRLVSGGIQEFNLVQLRQNHGPTCRLRVLFVLDYHGLGNVLGCGCDGNFTARLPPFPLDRRMILPFSHDFGCSGSCHTPRAKSLDLAPFDVLAVVVEIAGR